MEKKYSKTPSELGELNFLQRTRMRKNILVSFLAIAAVLLLVTNVSALSTSETVKVEGEYLYFHGDQLVDNYAVELGETVTFEVIFTATEYDSDVEITVELDGKKLDAEETVLLGDVEPGKRYADKVRITIPEGLEEELSDDVSVSVEIAGDEHKTELDDIATLRVQRKSYEVEVKFVSTIQNIEAGELLPVDVVLKNIGYNDLDDVYVTVSIPALGAERTAYFGDIVALECDDDNTDEFPWNSSTLDRGCDEDDEDTAYGRILLQVPETANSGEYVLEVEVSTDETTTAVQKQVSVSNPFSGNNVIATITGRSVAVDEDAEYSLLIVNPTDKVKVYRVVPETSEDLSVSVDEIVVAVPAGSSKTVTVTANAAAEGTYNFNVDVISGEELVESVALSATVEGSEVVSNPIVVLTVVLAIIFIVLLIVLIVLLGKKPEKSEEFGESYY